MSFLFDLYILPYQVLIHLDPLAGHLIVGVLIATKMGLGGWVLARTGRSPLWILALLVPWLDLGAIWLFAWASWPAEAGRCPVGPAEANTPNRLAGNPQSH